MAERANRPDVLELIGRDVAYAGMLAVWSPALLYRIAKGKYRKGWKDKLGFVPAREPLVPPNGRVWIHAVSVGEAVAASTLAGALRPELPGREIVVSTTTPTGQEVARDRFGAEKVFYLPLDFSGPVRRAFRRTRPSAIVLMELEIWPNLVAQACREGVPVVVVNGRISGESLPRYRRVSRLLKGTMRRIAAFGAQTEDYAERFRQIGAPPERVFVTGSLKYDGVKTDPDPEARSRARRELRLREGERLLLGGSTHHTEELALAMAWRRVARPETEGEEAWRLVIAPRHPPRIREAESDLAGAGFRTVRRTRMRDDPSVEIDRDTIVLVDTVGELGRFYHAADLVFVGGSLIPHGGQNPIEPAGLSKPVIYGPHMFNFQETVDLLREAAGARAVGTAEELAREVKALAADADARRRLGKSAREAILSRQGAARRSAELVRNALAGAGGLP